MRRLFLSQLCASLLLTACRSSRRYLPKEMQDKQTPFAFYLTPALAQVKEERAERASLGAGQPYNRQLP